MENVIKYVIGFFGGLLSIMMAVLPVDDPMECFNWSNYIRNGCSW